MQVQKCASDRPEGVCADGKQIVGICMLQRHSPVLILKGKVCSQKWTVRTAWTIINVVLKRVNVKRPCAAQERDVQYGAE